MVRGFQGRPAAEAGARGPRPAAPVAEPERGDRVPAALVHGAAGGLTAAQVLSLQRSIGNRAVGVLLAARRGGTAARGRLQRVEYQNTTTHRTFTVSWSAGDNVTVTATEKDPQIWGRPQLGSAQATIIRTAPVHMELHTINVTPERGTGLGILLMYILAHLAEAERCVRIDILTPAVPVVRYYEEKIGAVLLADDAEQAQILAQGVVDMEALITEQEGSRDRAWEQVVAYEAEQRWEERGFDHPAFVKWSELSTGQKQGQKRRTERELQDEGDEKVSARIKDYIHGRAVGGATMTVAPAAMKQSLAGSFARWTLL
ncbi:MAG: hypothetical protein JWM27_1089 [Gemmatimonadetes bacterium]|nr:hypothetical protein [Gemmatimonadota bacterium]